MGEIASKIVKRATVSVSRLGGNEVQYIKAFTEEF
jgi:hypothetical protein